MKSNALNQALNNETVPVIERSQEIEKTDTPGAITSEALFAGKRELLIQHANDSYRLRITNQGKLILTK